MSPQRRFISTLDWMILIRFCSSSCGSSRGWHVFGICEHHRSEFLDSVPVMERGWAPATCANSTLRPVQRARTSLARSIPEFIDVKPVCHPRREFEPQPALRLLLTGENEGPLRGQ
jgi:hypothetical protein